MWFSKFNTKRDTYQAGKHSRIVSEDIATVKGCILRSKNRNSINLSVNNVRYVLQLRYNFLSLIALMDKGYKVLSAHNCVLMFGIILSFLLNLLTMKIQ